MAELKPSARVDIQLQTLYPTVPQTDVAKGRGPNGETVQTNLKLVEPVSAAGGQISLSVPFTEKFMGVGALLGGYGTGSHFELLYGGGGLGVERSFTEKGTWSAAVLAGYRANFILDADGNTHGLYFYAELNGREFFHPNLALVGGMGIYAPALERLEQFYTVGLRWIFGNNSNGGDSK